MLVGVKDDGLSFHLIFNRQDLLLEVASLDRGCCPLVALHGQCILGLSSDPPLACHILSCHAHMAVVKWITQCSYHHIDQLSVTHALAPPCARERVGAAAHHFSSAAYCHFGITHINGLSC